jgi:hypothetical protein
MRTILLILLGTYTNQTEYCLDHIPHFDIQCNNIWYGLSPTTHTSRPGKYLDIPSQHLSLILEICIPWERTESRQELRYFIQECDRLRW